MADELALKRLKAANETIEMLQRKIAATKQVRGPCIRGGAIVYSWIPDSYDKYRKIHLKFV